MKSNKMKSGYTTGTCATAGVKACLLALLEDEIVETLSVLSPQGRIIKVPIKEVVILGNKSAKAIVIKDAGDDPDITNGAEIITNVEINSELGVKFKAGEGVGIITKEGLSLPIGEPAINLGPRTMIKQVYDELCANKFGITVTVSVTNGKELAKKTLNQTLGIIGGISIIGTTGIVRPMSEEAFKDSLLPQLDIIKAAGYNTIVLVPGQIGKNIAKQVGIKSEQLAETSNFIGFMLEKSVEIGFKNIIIIGHIGKLIKLSSGSFHTHNRMSDGRLETLAAYAGLYGADVSIIKEILEATTTEAVIPILKENNLNEIYQYAADRASERAMRYVAKEARVGVIMATLKGDILAVSKMAEDIGKEVGWIINCIL